MMHKKIDVVIADDHSLFRKGMRSILSDFENIASIHEAANGKELIDLLEVAQPTPDVVLLDLNMPIMDGVEATEIIRRDFPDVKIIVLSMQDDERFILHLIEKGINGYLFKNSDPEEVESALEMVMHKKFYFNDEMSELIFEAYKEKQHRKESEEFTLSDREQEVLYLICKEYTANEIGEALNLSPRTIEGYRRDLIRKTGARNSAGLVMYAIKNNLVEIQ